MNENSLRARFDTLTDFVFLDDMHGLAVAQMLPTYDHDGKPKSADNAQRIVACVNACKDIPTSALTALEWQLTIKGAATPEQVARLLLKLNEYRDMMAKLIEQARRCNFMDENGHLLSMNTAYQAIEEVLK